MKTNLPHRVPLSIRVIEILRQQRDMHSEAKLVFPAQRGGILCDTGLTKFLRHHKAHSSDKDRTATAHGFRSSALTHSDGSGISESFLKIDTADADHWKGFDVLLCALM